MFGPSYKEGDTYVLKEYKDNPDGHTYVTIEKYVKKKNLIKIVHHYVSGVINHSAMSVDRFEKSYVKFKRKKKLYEKQNKHF